jgi:AcrR family transcriptional regulator
MKDKNNNKPEENFNKSVQDRLLDSAEELFCEHGFEGTSIRDIAAAADCNIASVNYYFGGKQQLYEQVWRRHLIPMRDARNESIERILQKEPKTKLENLIKSFANAFVGSILDVSKTSRLGKLMAREYINRHLPVKMFIDEVIAPTIAAMQKALEQTCPKLDESKVPLIVFSLLGQLVHLVHVRAIFDEGSNDASLETFDFAEAIDHIVKFSSAGIRAYVKEKNNGKK